MLDNGVDGFIIETMTALDEMTIAVEAVRQVCNDLPILASMAFDKTKNDFRTMMGVGIEQMAAEIMETDSSNWWFDKRTDWWVNGSRNRK